jgi:Uncharacterized conserved protein
MQNNKQNTVYMPLTPQEEVMLLVREWSLKEKSGDKTARKWAANRIKDFLVETDDGTYTLKSQTKGDSSETMHTIHGALSEARRKFAEPAKLKGKKSISILDICSGLGLNAAATLDNIMDDEFLMDGDLEFLEIDLVEISWETLAAALIIPCPSKSHHIIKKAIENYLIHQGLLIFPAEQKEIPCFVDIRVHCEDARKMIMKIPENQSYDAVFLDPFSPARSPELYSKEFLSRVRTLLKIDGIILTYTSAAPVRYALLDAGLEVGEGPAMGRSGGTIASPNSQRISKSLEDNDERMIALSDAGIPFRDPELNLSAERIIENRHQERMMERGNSKMASTVKTPIYLASDLDDERKKRRVLKHLDKFGIDDLNLLKSRYLVCPQFSICICNCGHGKPSTSRARIKEMEKRLDIVANGNFKMIIE